MSDFTIGLGIGLISAIFCLIMTLSYLSWSNKKDRYGLPETDTYPPMPKDIKKPLCSNSRNHQGFCPDCKKLLVLDKRKMSPYDFNSRSINCNHCGSRINWENIQCHSE